MRFLPLLIALLAAGPAWADAFSSTAPATQPDGSTITINAGKLTANNTGCSTNCTFATPAVSGGTIDGATIGASTPAAGTFSALTSTASTNQFGTGQSQYATAGGSGAGGTVSCGGNANCNTNIFSNGTGDIQLFPGGSAKFSRTISQARTQTLVTGTGFNNFGVNPAGLWQSVTVNGAYDTGTQGFNYMNMTDQASSNVGNAGVGITQLSVLNNYNTGADGGRGTWLFQFSKNAPSVSGGGIFVPMSIYGKMLASEGGTAGTPKGGITLMNPDLTCNGGDYLIGCTGEEADLRLYSGSHATYKTIKLLHYGINDAAHGTLEDSAISISSALSIADGTGGGTVMLQLGSGTQQWPFDNTQTTSSKLVGIVYTNAGVLSSGSPARYFMGYGIDLAPAHIAQYAWRSSGFWVDGGGQVSAGPATITYGATGATIATPNLPEVSAAVVSGGSGYKVNDQIMDPATGLWTVSTVSGTAVTALTLLNAAYPASCPAASSATTGGNGSGLTITVTCSSTANGVTVQSSGGKVGFYGATPTAKLTPVGACAGNTGCQALRDALGTLGLINTGSVTN